MTNTQIQKNHKDNKHAKITVIYTKRKYNEICNSLY